MFLEVIFPSTAGRQLSYPQLTNLTVHKLQVSDKTKMRNDQIWTHSTYWKNKYANYCIWSIIVFFKINIK